MQLTPEQVGSVNLLLAAAQLAQKRGAFSLKEAHALQEAIELLAPHTASEEEMQQMHQAQQEQELNQERTEK
jgi:hypothetical protein